MSDLAFNLLGNMAYSYGRNPDVVGIKDGQPVNANGEVVPFMKQPNLIGRMFNPLASRAMELNSQVENAPLLAKSQADIEHNTRVSQYWDALPDADKAVYNNDPNNWYAHTGGTPQNIDMFNHQGSQSLYANNGGRQIDADRLLNEANYAKQAAANRLKLEGMRSINGFIPESANAELTGTQLQGSRNAYQLSGLPQEATNYDLGQANTGTKLLGEQAALPYTTGADLTMAQGRYNAAPYAAKSMQDQAILGSLGDEQRLNLAPYALGANRINTLRESALAPYGGQANPMSMGAVYTDPNTGRTSMEHNPFSTMDMLGGQAHAPVPGLQGAFAPTGGAMPVTIGNPSDERGNNYSGSYGVNAQNQSSLVPVDELHAADKNGQIYYNQGTPQQPQYIPIKTASADLQKKAIDAVHSVTDRELKKNKLLGQLQELRHEADKNTIGSQVLPALGREAALISSPIVAPAMGLGYLGYKGLQGAGHLIGHASESVLNSLGYE